MGAFLLVSVQVKFHTKSRISPCFSFSFFIFFENSFQLFFLCGQFLGSFIFLWFLRRCVLAHWNFQANCKSFFFQLWNMLHTRFMVSNSGLCYFFSPLVKYIYLFWFLLIYFVWRWVYLTINFSSKALIYGISIFIGSFVMSLLGLLYFFLLYLFFFWFRPGASYWSILTPVILRLVFSPM